MPQPVIDKPGIYTLPADAYHADPCPEPSLSASIADKLIDDSPRHAWHAHPRLNPSWEPSEPTAASEFGDVVHRIFLGAGKDFVEVAAKNWQSKDAQAKRAAIRAEGMVAVLSDTLIECHRCAASIRAQLQEFPEVLGIFHALEDGAAEQTVIWQDRDGAWCRSLIDWLPADPNAPLIDLKTTSGSANPEKWERRMINEYAVQSSFYPRGVAAVRGIAPPAMLFVVVEQKPPYALSVCAAHPSFEAMAGDMTERAIDLWNECRTRNQWPGYPAEIAWIEAPAWATQREDDRRLRRSLASKSEGAQFQRLMAAAGGPPA